MVDVMEITTISTPKQLARISACSETEVSIIAVTALRFLPSDIFPSYFAFFTTCFLSGYDKIAKFISTRNAMYSMFKL